MPPIWTNTFKLLSHIQPSYENKMSDLVGSDIKHSLLCWVSITKSVWCENIASFTQATPSKSIWLNKDYILLRATCDKVPLLTMSRPYSPDIFRSSCVKTTAFSCCQTKQIVPLDTELLERSHLTLGNRAAISVTAMQIFSEQGRKLQ